MLNQVVVSCKNIISNVLNFIKLAVTLGTHVVTKHVFRIKCILILVLLILVSFSLNIVTFDLLRVYEFIGVTLERAVNTITFQFPFLNVITGVFVKTIINLLNIPQTLWFVIKDASSIILSTTLNRYNSLNQIIYNFFLESDRDFNNINKNLRLEYSANKQLFDSLQQPDTNLNYNELLTLDLNKNLNYSINNHFPMYQSQVMITLTAWQYWWWMAFIFVITLFNRLIAKIFLSDNININPNTYTPLKANGRWGDLLASTFPIFWCANILINSNFILKLTENHSESSLFTLRVRGKQWYWVYKTSVNLYSDLYNQPVVIGRGNIIDTTILTNRLSNTLKTPYKSQFLNKMYNYNSTIVNKTTKTPESIKTVFNTQKLVRNRTDTNPTINSLNLLAIRAHLASFRNVLISGNWHNFKYMNIGLFKKLQELFLLSRSSRGVNAVKSFKSVKNTNSNNINNNVNGLSYNKNYYNTSRYKLMVFKTLKFNEDSNYKLLTVKYNDIHWFKQYNRHFHTIQQQPVSVWNFNNNLIITSVMNTNKLITRQNVYSNLKNSINSVQSKLEFKTNLLKENSSLFNIIRKTNAYITDSILVNWLKSNNIVSESTTRKLFIKPVNEFFKRKVLAKNRLISCHNSLLLPTKTNITVITNSFDVVHSWFIPGLGIKFDCVPGRSTHYTFRVDKAGIYFGHCAEVCGRFHHHMPIKVVALPMHQFIYYYNVYYPENGTK